MSRRFRPTVDIHALSDAERATLIPGQWVSAGAPDAERNNCGRFYGVRASGSVVVAWNGNARNRGWKEYQKAMHQFATSK